MKVGDHLSLKFQRRNVLSVPDVAISGFLKHPLMPSISPVQTPEPKGSALIEISYIDINTTDPSSDGKG